MFGIVFVKAEVVSWFRIQEMFRLSSFHTYGVIGAAVVVQDKTLNKGQICGGLVFGLGWALTGACPGPLFAQIGAGYGAVGITLVSAVTGTWLYGYFRERLPH